MSFDSEKSFDRILDTFMIKALRELGLEGEPPSHDWRHLRKPTAETSSYWCDPKRNRPVLQEDTIILSMFALAVECQTRLGREAQGGVGESTVTGGVLNTQLSDVGRASRQKIHEHRHQPTGRGDISRLLLPTAAEHTFFSSSPATFAMV